MEYFNKDTNNEKAKVITDALKKAAELVHASHLAKTKSERALAAIKMTDKYAMWEILQDYYREYKGFINSLSGFTGYTIYDVEKDFTEKITAEDIRDQLNKLIGFIYAKEAVNSAIKQTYKDCVKHILKETKLFTDKELALI